ncbi:hypothetical protein FB451DRAFT_1409789 [Mycena latifolia]|nr:hypothetical protein FB451DRAFT_1409789 [Mycena latifolia]
MAAADALIDGATARAWTAITLAGTWSTTAFFTLEIIVSIIYMRNWKPSKTYKYGVFAMLLVDSVTAFMNFATVFMMFVLHDPNVPWAMPLSLISYEVSAFIGRSYLIHIHWLIAKKTLVSVFLMLIGGADVGLIVGVALAISLGSQPSDQSTSSTVVSLPTTFTAVYFPFLRPLSQSSAVLSASGDGLIAFSFAWSTWGRTPFAVQPPNWLRKMGINILSSGAVVATVSLLTMIMVLDNRDLTATFLASLNPHLYSLTVLANLIIRSAYFKPRPSSAPGRYRDGQSLVVVEGVMCKSPALLIHVSRLIFGIQLQAHALIMTVAKRKRKWDPLGSTTIVIRPVEKRRNRTENLKGPCTIAFFWE